MRTDVKVQNEYKESVRIPRDSRYTNYGMYLPKKFNSLKKIEL